MSYCECNVQACPPTRTLIWISRIVFVDKMHECWLVEEREHAVEMRKVILQERQCFCFRGQRLVHTALEYVTKDVWLPLDPFVVFHGCISNHILERTVAGF